MAAPPSLTARGNELKIGCEIETLVSLVAEKLAPTGNATKDSVNAAKAMCTKYRPMPQKGEDPQYLNPDFVDYLPFEGPMYSTWVLTDDSTIKGANSRENLYALENNIQEFKGKTVAECMRVIEACQTIDSLADLMNDKGSNRYFAWNFQNLDEKRGTGTVEWRQPAGMDSAQGCIAWIELAVAFVQAARRPDLDCRRYTGTVEGLRDFLWMGVVTEASDARFMDAILNKDKTGAAALVEAKQPSEAELKTKIKEDQRKNLMLRKLNERLNAEALAAKAAAAKKAAEDAAAGKGGRK